MAKQKMPSGTVFVLVTAAVAVLARFVHIDGDFANLPSMVRSILYIHLMIFWCITMRRRVMQVQVRRYLTFVSLLTVFWLLVRTIKYFFVFEPHAAILLWYLYYLPMLFIPMLAVFVAASLGKSENYRIPKSAWIVYTVTLLLFLLVLTNNLHQFVFVFAPDMPRTDQNYSYGIGFYFVIGWAVMLSLAAFAIMVKRCRVRTFKTATPLICMGLSFLYALLYALDLPWLREIANDLTVVQCCLFTLTFECCIRCRLIQCNTGYADLFEASTLGVQIVDDRYRVQYASRHAPALTPEIMRRAESAPFLLDKNTSIKSCAIPGGHVLWKEDISEVAALLDELETVGHELEEHTLVEQENYKAKRSISALRERNRLLDLVQQQTQAPIAVLDGLLAQYGTERDEAKRRHLLVQTAVIGTYIKRMGNLVLLCESNDTADMEELARCVEESFLNLELMDVVCGCDLPKNEAVRTEDILRAYRLFEAVVETASDSLDAVWVKGRAEGESFALRITVSCPCDLSALADEADDYTAEDDCVCFTVRMGKGGASL